MSLESVFNMIHLIVSLYTLILNNDCLTHKILDNLKIGLCKLVQACSNTHLDINILKNFPM